MLLPIQSSESYSRQFSLPPAPIPTEPYEGAWFQEGDIVEAKYNCQHNGTCLVLLVSSLFAISFLNLSLSLSSLEWYRGKIHGVLANEAIYDVEYEDGEIDESLSSDCVRPFVPYQVGDVVEARVSEESFAPGKIVQVYDSEEVYDVKTDQGTFLSKLSAGNIRRFRTLPPLQVGVSVLSRFQGGQQFFPGRVVQTNPDGTYAVRYDDGDFEASVSKDLLRVMAR